MNIVVDNIRAIIKANGLKQKYVAEKAGFTPQEFSNMLNGRKQFQTEYVNRVCNALSITPNDLFRVKNETKSA